MPWKEVCLVSIREEFVLRALEADANHAALCREYGIARKTGYKWIDRFQQGGVVALRNLDRRPLNSPLKVNGDVVAEYPRDQYLVARSFGAARTRLDSCQTMDFFFYPLGLTLTAQNFLASTG